MINKFIRKNPKLAAKRKVDGRIVFGGRGSCRRCPRVRGTTTNIICDSPVTVSTHFTTRAGSFTQHSIYST